MIQFFLALLFAFPILATDVVYDFSCMECCDGDPPPPECDHCSPATAQSTYYVSGLSGVTNANCSDCPDYNTDPIALHYVSECRWEAADFGGCAGGTPTLVVNSDGSATFTAGGATYTVAEFDCEGSNTFSLDSAGTDCDDWPEEITIDDGAVEVECCPGLRVPTTLSATIQAPECEELDGFVYTLEWQGPESGWVAQEVFDCVFDGLTCNLFCNGTDISGFILTLFSGICGEIFPGFVMSSGSCDPLQFVFTAVFGCNCCEGGSGDMTITITA